MKKSIVLIPLPSLIKKSFVRSFVLSLSLSLSLFMEFTLSVISLAGPISTGGVVHLFPFMLFFTSVFTRLAGLTKQKCW